MNRFIYILITSLITSIIVTSCSAGDEPYYPKPVTLLGDWRMERRTIETGEKELNNRINWLLQTDSIQFNITRTYKEIEPGIGSYQDYFYIRGSQEENPDRKNEGTYYVKGDSIYVNDLTLGKVAYKFELTSTTLTTYTKVTKGELDIITIELGGDPRLNPEGLEGVITTIERR